MILRLAIYGKNYDLKHSFIWKEGESVGTCIQHVNMWVHPEFTISMFMDVTRSHLQRSDDTIMVFYWDRANGRWFDLD